MVLLIYRWYYLNVNPEPWKVPPFRVGRKNGKYFPMAGRDAGLHAYEQAVKEGVENPLLLQGEVALRFLFWRNRAEYLTPQARTHRKHQADLTNLTKSTEDALQGVLFSNDRDVQHSEGTIVEQGPSVEGKIVIGVTPWDKAEVEIPNEVWNLIDENQLTIFDLEEDANIDDEDLI